MTTGIAGQLSLYDLLDSPTPDNIEAADSQSDLQSDSQSDLQPDFQSDLRSDSHSDSHSDLLSLPPLQIEVTRSKRRRKTAGAHLVDSVLAIRIPAACSAEEEQYFVDHFREKFERSRAAAIVDLDARARELAKAYGLPLPRSIRWVSNQKHQWGSCTPSEGTIRLSDRMAEFPRWVVDYVIVHELGHLVHGDHSAAFWELVNAYPKTERARGYLMAKDGV